MNAKQKAKAAKQKITIAQQWMMILKTSLEILFGPRLFKRDSRRRIALKMCIGRAIMLAAIAIDYGDITPELLSQIRGWHGSILEQMNCIRALLHGLVARQSTVSVPNDYITLLDTNLKKIEKLVAKSGEGDITAKERRSRNTALKTTVAFSLHTIRVWVFGQYADGNLTIDDVHDLGFLLPGEMSGHHSKTDPTDIIADVKPLIITADMFRAIIDQAAFKNAGPVVHGWPHGVRTAALQILADDGVTEIKRLMTTRLHTDIEMPADCHGKQYVVKAAFLKHVDDTPRWSAGASFTMPKDTADLARVLDQQHYEDFEESLRTVERHRQDVERLHAEMEAARANRGGASPAN
jgi:hypothetical protein